MWTGIQPLWDHLSQFALWLTLWYQFPGTTLHRPVPGVWSVFVLLGTSWSEPHLSLRSSLSHACLIHLFIVSCLTWPCTCPHSHVMISLSLQLSDSEEMLRNSGSDTSRVALRLNPAGAGHISPSPSPSRSESGTSHSLSLFIPHSLSLSTLFLLDGESYSAEYREQHCWRIFSYLPVPAEDRRGNTVFLFFSSGFDFSNTGLFLCSLRSGFPSHEWPQKLPLHHYLLSLLARR